MDTTKLFSQPQKLIDRTKRSIDALDDISNDFFSWKNFESGTRREGDFTVQKLRLKNPIPDIVEEHVTNSLNNIKNAFDQIIYAACIGVGHPRKDLYYPWAENPQDLEGRMTKPKKRGQGIPEQLWDTIRAQEPFNAGSDYTGGHSHLRAMARLANDKHTIGFHVDGQVNRFSRANTTVTGNGTFWFPLHPRWDPVLNEIEIGRYSTPNAPEIKGQHVIDLKICFSETAGPLLHRVAVAPAIWEFTKYAQRCLDGFQKLVSSQSDSNHEAP